MFALFLQALRSWKHAKAVGLLAVAALAVGVGSTTAIYTVVQSVLLNPLPYANPDRYLAVRGAWQGVRQFSAWSYPNCIDFSQRASTVDAFGCVAYLNYNVGIGGQAIHADGVEVSPALVRSMGIPMLLGGWFSSGPDTHLAVISEQLWRRAGSNPNIDGSKLTINSVPYTVVGVAPAWFHFPIDRLTNDVWVPLDPTPGMRISRDAKYMAAFAKMKAGVNLTEATADLKRVAAELQREYPNEKNHTVVVQSLLSDAVAYVRPSLLILLAAAAALLLIACGNVGSLFLARSVARARETAIRVALGGSALQLSAQYISEGISVALAGAILGTAFSVVLVRSVLEMASDVLPRADQIHLNWQVLLVTLATALCCGVLFSLAPLWQALRTAPNKVLTSGLRASAGAATRRLLRFLVVGEIALSFVLLAVAGVFLAHMDLLFHTDPGFKAWGLTTFSLYVSPRRFTPERRRENQAELLAAVRGIPGAIDVAFTSALPFTSYSDILAVPDHRDIKSVSIPDLVKLYDYQMRHVSDGFFQTMGIPLLSGHDLPRSEPKGATQSVVISATVAHRLWPNQDPLGHTLNLGDDQVEFRVVGVVGDVLEQLDRPSPGHIYVSNVFWPREFSMHWAVRSKLSPAALMPEIRRAVASVDRQEAPFDIRPMLDLVANAIGRERLQSFVVSFFGAAALLLSILGVYGVVSYSVRQRLPEMATRLALGATGNRLIGMVLREALRTAVLGSLLGFLLVLAVARLFEFVGVHGTDARPYLLALVLVSMATLLASLAPAFSSGVVSPLMALGDEAENIGRRVRLSYRQLVHLVAPPNAALEMAILSEVTESTRHAASFNEAIHDALSTVVSRTLASGATLLVRRSPDQPFRCLSSFPGNNQHWTLPQRTLLLNRLLHFYPGLPITQGDLDAFARWAEKSDLSRIEEIGTLQAIGPAAVIPVQVKDEIAGILFVNPAAPKTAFDPSEMRLLRSVASQFALMLENSRLTDRIIEQDRLRRDLALAAEVQQRLFPEHAPEVTTARLSGFCLPARGVGGDLYDFFRLDDRGIGVAIADVAGKGIAAALLTSIIQASLRSLAGTDGDSPAALAAKVNKLLCDSTGPSGYATFFYAKYDEAQRRLCYVNGGHNPPLLLRRDGGPIEELAAGGMIIGMFPFAAYEETLVDVSPGDVLLAYTDGVSEAHNPDEDEFTDGRLKELLRTYSHLPVDEMSTAIFERLKAWMQDAPQFDDLTFVLMKVL